MAVSRAQFDAYARRNRNLTRQVARAVDELWDSLDTSDMESLARDLAIYLPAIADRYGKACAVFAADFYDRSRKAAGAKGRYRATTSKGASWKVERDVKYATGAAMAYGDVKAFLTASVEAVVRDYGRQTIMDNSRSDPFSDGYCSVPTSDNPCVFCIIKALGSYRKYRGEILDYEITEDAWHDNCSCELIPTWKETPHWAEGDYDRYWDMYQAGRSQAYTDSGKSVAEGLSAAEVMAGMRKANGIDH